MSAYGAGAQILGPRERVPPANGQGGGSTSRAALGEPSNGAAARARALAPAPAHKPAQPPPPRPQLPPAAAPEEPAKPPLRHDGITIAERLALEVEAADDEVDVLRIWSTCLALATMEMIDVTWLVDPEKEKTIVDHTRMWLDRRRLATPEFQLAQRACPRS